MFSMANPRGGPGGFAVPEIPIVPILVHFGFDENELHDYGGGWRKVRCAFHGERNPSASYSVDKRGFNCHACGVEGDAIKLLQTQEGLSFRDALTKACELAGINPAGLPAQKETSLQVKRVSGAEVARNLLGGGSQPLVRKKRGITL